MNFYLAAVDDALKHASDQPSIGLILCKSKTEVVVEYSLRGTTTPMGISEFTHLVKLPEELRGSLPTIEEIEAELSATSVTELRRAKAEWSRILHKEINVAGHQLATQRDLFLSHRAIAQACI